MLMLLMILSDGGDGNIDDDYGRLNESVDNNRERHFLEYYFGCISRLFLLNFCVLRLKLFHSV